MKKQLFLFVALLFVALNSQAQTIHSVPGSYATIQAAITAAVNGDIVEVDAGTYAQGATQININKSITLRAKAGLSTKPKITTSYTSYSDCAVRIGAANIVIDGFEIDGSSAFSTFPSGTSIYLIGDYNGGTNVGYDSWTVKNCYLHNAREGVRLSSDNYVIIQANEIGQTVKHCIDCSYGFCNGIKVTQNWLHSEQFAFGAKPAGLSYMFYNLPGADIEISYNYCTACRTFCDFAHSGNGTEPNNKVLIMHNTVDWNLQALPSPVTGSENAQQWSIAFWTGSTAQSWDASKFIIRDNIFSRQKYYEIANADAAGQGIIIGSLNIQNNLFYKWYLNTNWQIPSDKTDNEWPGAWGAVGWTATDGTPTFTNDLQADPLYKSAGTSASAYYALTAGSPAHNAATDGTNMGAWQPLPVHNVTQDTYFNTIQPAVNAANAGDEIDVATGTYNEQVVIDKPITVAGVGNTTLLQPTQVTYNTFQKFTSGTTTSTGIIVINDLAASYPGTVATISNMKVDYSNIHTTLSGVTNDCGVFTRASSAVINNITVVDNYGKMGQGIYGIPNDVATQYTVNVEIENCNILNYFSNGITCYGVGMTANIHNNVVDGMGPTTKYIQNGIQIGYGATGNVTYNTLNVGDVYTGTAGWTSTGIFMLNCSGTVNVTNNTINNSQSGIDVDYYPFDGILPSGSTGYTCNVLNNTITMNIAQKYSPVAITFQTWNKNVNGSVTVTGIAEGNTITGSGLEYGLFGNCYDKENYTPVKSYENITVNNNTFTNLYCAIDFYDESVVYSEVSGNSFSDGSPNPNNGYPGDYDVYYGDLGPINLNNCSLNSNSFLGSTNPVTADVDAGTLGTLNATCNWWGTTETASIASENSGSVTYLPWLSSGIDGDLVTPGFQPSVACTGSCNLALSISSANANCPLFNDGTASVSVTGGGISPYTYLWSNSATTASISGLVAGTYTVTVTDINGCSATAGVTIMNSLAGPVHNISTGLNYCTIQTAINDPLTLNGHTITVDAGTYLFTSDINISKSLTILGPNAGISPLGGGGGRVPEAIINGNAAGSFTGGSGHHININGGVTSLTFNGFKLINFDGNMFYASATPFTAINLNYNIFDANNGGLLYTAQSGMATYNFTYNRVANQTTVNTYTSILFLSNPANSHFDNNEVANCPGRELANIYGSIDNTTFDGNSLSNSNGLLNLYAFTSNLIEVNNNNFTNMTNIPIVLGTTQGISEGNITINNNVISGAAGYGIALLNNTQKVNWWDQSPYTGLPGVITNVTIDHNTISGTTKSPIDADAMADGSADVANNVVSNLTVTNNVITHNVGILSSAYAAVDLRSIGGTNLVSGNSITFTGTLSPGNNSCGIRIRGSHTGTFNLSQNVLSGNGITSTATPPFSGIYIETNNATYGAIQPTAVINATNNSINGFQNGVTVFSSVGSAWGGLPLGAHVAFNNNDLSGNSVYGMRSGTGEIIDATCNWWGVTSDAAIAAMNSGPVTYSPWLISGTDNEPLTPGFQPAGACSGSTLALSETHVNVGCYGDATGSATVNHTGGIKPYTYNWNTVPAQTSKTASGLIAGTYSVTVSDSLGSTATTSVVISQPLAALALSTTHVNVTCNLAGTNGSIDLTVNGGTTPYSYLWSNSATTEDLSTIAAGTYRVTVTDAHSCTSTSSTNVLVNPFPVATASSSAPPVCNGSQLNLYASGGISYAWSGPASYTSISQNPVINPATINNKGTFIVTVTDGNGCTASASTYVNVILPIASASSNSPVNSGTQLNLTASGGTTYSWSGPGGFTSTLQNPSVSSATTSGTYAVTVTDNNTCTANATTYVNVIPVAIATAGSNSPICSGKTLQLSSTGGGSYSWSGPNGFSSGMVNPSIANVTIAATGTYTVTVTNANGSTATASTAVTINASPAPVASNNSPVCAGNQINLSVTGIGTYSWAGPISFTSTLQNPTSIATTSNAGTYSVTVTNANGCSANTSTYVSVNPLPAATASSNSPLCSGNTLQLNSTVGGSYYSWSGPNSFTSALPSPTIGNVTTAATGTYTVTITNSYGCTSTASINVTVNQSPSAPVAGSNSPIGAGNTINLTATGSGTFSWAGPSYTSTLQNPGISNATTSNAGIYYVTVTNSGCSASTSTYVNVTSLVATASGSSPICSGSTLQLYSTGGGTYSWSGPNSFTSTLQNPYITSATVAASGTYTVTVTNAGNSATASKVVTVNQSPVPVASSNTPACAGSTLTLSVTGVGTYSWTGPASFTSTLQSPVINNVTTSYKGTYNVTVNNNGCSAKTSTVIAVNATPAVPTVSSNSPVVIGAQLKLTSSIAISYTWSGPSSFTSTVQNPTINNYSNANAGTYTVTDRNTYGCSAAASVVVASSARTTAGNNNTYNPGSSIQTGIMHTALSTTVVENPPKDDAEIDNINNPDSSTKTGSMDDVGGIMLNTNPVLQAEDNKINIYPNPTNGKLFIDLSLVADVKTKIVLCDLMGKTIKIIDEGVFRNKLISTDFYNLSSGVYLIKIDLPDKTILRKLSVIK